MLPIAPNFFDTIVYIYRSLDDAKADRKIGGSGFLVGVMFETNADHSQLYVVTNRHVLARHPNPAIRINLSQGSFDFVETNANRWICHPDGDDLAILPLDICEDTYRYACIPMDMFYMGTPEQTPILAGDEVFMIGRVASLEGTTQNAPVARFGNLARVVGDPIETDWGYHQETFLVDCRSIPGYSGSPVFLSMFPNKPRPPMFLVIANPGYDPKRHGPFLIGIDWLHIQGWQTVQRFNHQTNTFEDTECRVASNTGLAGVIPAWRLHALLHTDQARQLRTVEDQRLTKAQMDAAHQ